MLINSFSISHSTQASIAPLLVSSFDLRLLSHFMLAASREHEAYKLTSCGVLATPPTMICDLGIDELGAEIVFCHCEQDMTYIQSVSHFCVHLNIDHTSRIALSMLVVTPSPSLLTRQLLIG